MADKNKTRISEIRIPNTTDKSKYDLIYPKTIDKAVICEDGQNLKDKLAGLTVGTSEVKASGINVIDGNRIDEYIATGTIEKPFKSFGVSQLYSKNTFFVNYYPSGYVENINTQANIIGFGEPTLINGNISANDDILLDNLNFNTLYVNSDTKLKNSIVSQIELNSNSKLIIKDSTINTLVDSTSILINNGECIIHSSNLINKSTDSKTIIVNSGIVEIYNSTILNDNSIDVIDLSHSSATLLKPNIIVNTTINRNIVCGNAPTVIEGVIKLDNAVIIGTNIIYRNANNISVTPSGNITAENVQSALVELDNLKENKATGAISNIVHNDLIAGKIVITDENGKVKDSQYDASILGSIGGSSVSELFYLVGVGETAPTSGLYDGCKWYKPLDNKIFPYSTSISDWLYDQGSVPDTQHIYIDEINNKIYHYNNSTLVLLTNNSGGVVYTGYKCFAPSGIGLADGSSWDNAMTFNQTNYDNLEDNIAAFLLFGDYIISAEFTSNALNPIIGGFIGTDLIKSPAVIKKYCGTVGYDTYNTTEFGDYTTKFIGSEYDRIFKVNGYVANVGFFGIRVFMKESHTGYLESSVIANNTNLGIDADKGIINNVHIVGCTGSSYGGGGEITASAVIMNSKIECCSNTGYGGGGLAITSGGKGYGLQVCRCSYTGTGENAYGGGGIAVVNGGYLYKGEIKGCTSTTYGGGILNAYDVNTVANSVVDACIADIAGGGIWGASTGCIVTNCYAPSYSSSNGSLTVDLSNKNTNIPFSINQGLTDEYDNPRYVKLTPNYTNINCTLDYNIATGGQHKYITTPTTYDLRNANSWEILISEFTYKGGASSAAIIGYSGSSDFQTPVLMIINNSLNVLLSYNGTSWGYAGDTGYTFTTNNTYWIKLGYNNVSGYYINVSTDGKNYNNIYSNSTIDAIYCSVPFMFLNLGLNENDYYNNGSLNIDECNIKINDSIVWSGVKQNSLSILANTIYTEKVITKKITINSNLDLSGTVDGNYNLFINNGSLIAYANNYYKRGKIPTTLSDYDVVLKTTYPMTEYIYTSSTLNESSLVYCGNFVLASGLITNLEIEPITNNDLRIDAQVKNHYYKLSGSIDSVTLISDTEVVSKIPNDVVIPVNENKFSLDSSEKYVTVNRSGILKVKRFVDFDCNLTPADIFTQKLYKNNVMVDGAKRYLGNYKSMESNWVLEVKKGDILNFTIQNSTGATITYIWGDVLFEFIG